MKKQLILLIMMLLPMLASAISVEIDGICYNLISKSKVAVVTDNPNKYAGNVVIPESISYEGMEYSVTTIGSRAFGYCSALISVTISNSVTDIGSSAFSNSGLKSVTIPNSVTDIGSSAFDCCYSLTSVTIPNSVTTISNAMFNNCIALTSVTIPNSVTKISEYAFSGCRSLRSVTIPNSVTNIGYHAFSNSGLTSVTIPNNVTYISQYAFSDCYFLTSVTIPNSVTSIGSKAFQNCTVLTDVYCFAWNVPETSIYTFQDSNIDYATLHVPSISVQLYKKWVPWKNFASIESIPDEDIDLKQCKKPSIRYSNGQLTFASETGGAKFITDITNSDIKRYNDTNIQLTATYTISVYAIKPGCENSDVVTATLCWIDAEPKTEDITNDLVNIPAKAVLIQADDGIINVQGTDDGTPVCVYGVNGSQAGSVISQNGAATINTSLPSGSVAIVKVGEKSIKVIVK